MKTMVLWDLHWASPIYGNYHFSKTLGSSYLWKLPNQQYTGYDTKILNKISGLILDLVVFAP